MTDPSREEVEAACRELSRLALALERTVISESDRIVSAFNIGFCACMLDNETPLTSAQLLGVLVRLAGRDPSPSTIHATTAWLFSLTEQGASADEILEAVREMTS